MKATSRRLLLVALLATAGIGWPDRAPAQALPGPGWIPLAPETLDGLRGGYQLPSGLLLSFGIERAAWVNGELVSYLRVDIPDIANITPAQAQELSKIAQTQLVQVGPGNVFNGIGNGGLVIQNTLDGQDIRASTTLDVSVNTLGLFQALNAGDALRNAAFTAPGAP
ncbi:hypothetical protein ACTJIL_07035 [Luteimonas sp. 22616]|uniref:hypothetical protein n=1 Tax=Luteimonas sp. 22616 TaxID=3453951 RepID=UPI003F83904A